MVAIIDYDAGNIKSVEKAIVMLGRKAILTRERDDILAADHVILPGVGAFGDAMDKLHRYGLVSVIREAVEEKIPFLGICLGLQLMFESSEEAPGAAGLGLLPGRIVRIPDGENLKIPHIGWNSLCFPNPGRLFQGIAEGSYVYFVHSYYLQAGDPQMVKAATEYGTLIHASVERDNVFACQFHPEKSSETGLKILQNFLDI
ncbi:MAG: imidazole glycerol phosphate synthase subunit HisH [Lachnospiraceae bacterium]|nr:imidazole glycerol phosphate synthase subunit HisH [Lachnospiraceae bacterium]MDE7359376.1 imidazole glycerol phosphate synthase subunit HisH [Lachnospiraceae bacterium]